MIWPAVAGLWWLICIGVAVLSVLTDRISTPLPWMAYCGVVSLMSVATFVVFGWDKRKAKVAGWRIPEKTLHLMAFLGGWPGAVVAQSWFRHKTIKPVFRAILVFIGLLHIGICVFLLLRP